MRRIIADAGYQPVQRRTLYDACHDLCCTSPIPEPKAATSQGLPVVGPLSGPLDGSVASA